MLSPPIEVMLFMNKSNENLPDELRKMDLSAAQIASLTRLRVEDIHYWTRKGYIRQSPNGVKRKFTLNDVPKISLMGKLAGKYKLEAVKASTLADDLLEMHANEPDAYAAALDLLEAFDVSLKTLAEVLAKVGFREALAATRLINDGHPAVDPIPDGYGGHKEKPS